MALYDDALKVILAEIKERSGVDLVEGEYLFSDPVAVPDAGDGNNTTLVITAKDVTSTYDGAVTMTYRRRQLSDLNILVPSLLKEVGLTTTLGVAQRLNQRFGTAFTAEDIVDGPLDGFTGTGDVTIVAEPLSRYWVGQVTFQVQPGRYPLADSIQVTNLPGLPYPNQDLAKVFGEMYSYWRSFTAQNEVLKDLTTETTDLTPVKNALAAITGDQWFLVGQSRYSLNGATILYNGATTGNEKLNTDYANGMIIQLSADCLGLSGVLYLHYNLPLDF